MTGCDTCDSIAARSVPGGCIHETRHWYVDHCVGPLGVGTLIVKPKRHVVHVADLETDEAAELGPLLQQATAVATELVRPDQVYVTLWSHAGGAPGHIHFVVQPVTREQMEEHGIQGPRLQVAMFDAGVAPDPDAMAEFAERARAAWPPAA
jgi:diadenosine tetraphosphate (Ap4A) HIT family hydrolase